MPLWAQIIIPIVVAMFGSTGLWAWIEKRSNKKDQSAKMLLGLGHDRIMTLGMAYIDRGWITHNEYENLKMYLYEPYKALGGNGSATRIMEEVDKLELR